MLIEIRKGIALGLLLTSFYGVKEHIYNLKTKFEEINGYKYKWSKDKKSTFIKKNLGYEKRFSKTASPEELENGLKKEYCNAVREIKKVDRKIVPGTNIPFKKATYTQVDDAYKEYLQKIAQIQQVVYAIVPDDNGNFEYYINCEYRGTKWNSDNSIYLTPLFYSSEANDYYSK
ncbi:hypothetical protein [Leptotrichia alba]|uniref:Uncharacterized protein n=1 Tax=Leptotrichia alba TaxID=3239304 RepID=A0AB39V6E1_9FUSO